MTGIKRILCGIAIILFGMLYGNMDNIWLPIVDTLRSDIIGVLIGFVGVVIAVKGCYQTTENERNTD